MRRNVAFEGAVAVLAALILLISAGCARKPERKKDNGLIIDRNNKRILFPATSYPSRFAAEGNDIPNYHAIVWEKGKSAKEALFVTPVPDREIYDALIEIGAKPGNNLTNETWSERRNPESKEPEKHAEGSLIEVQIYPGKNSQPVKLRSFFTDGTSRKGLSAEDVVIRFAGNEDKIGAWKSGCIICLYSCPGAKTPNSAYSVRDYVNDPGRFQLNPEMSLPEGTPVTVEFRLAD